MIRLRCIFRHFLIFEDKEREDFIIGDLEGLLVEFEPIGTMAVKPRVSIHERTSAAAILTKQHFECI